MDQRSMTQISKFLILLVLLILFSNPTLAQSPQGGALNEVQNTLIDIQSQLATLQSSVNDVQSDVNGLEADVNNLQIDVGNLETTVENIQGSVDLGGVTQNWDKKLPADDTGDPCDSSRFTCVLDGQAVRDNETGLVWERFPSTTATSWYAAINHCSSREVSERFGWRLPMDEELSSLLDLSVTSILALPDGHPFQNIQPNIYWTGNTKPEIPFDAQKVTFSTGATLDTPGKNTPHYVWCVRGGQGFDGNTHSTLH